MILESISNLDARACRGVQSVRPLGCLSMDVFNPFRSPQLCPDVT